MPKDQEELEHEAKMQYYQMKWEFRRLVLQALFLLIAAVRFHHGSIAFKMREQWETAYHDFMRTHFPEK